MLEIQLGNYNCMTKKQKIQKEMFQDTNCRCHWSFVELLWHFINSIFFIILFQNCSFTYICYLIFY